MPVNTQELMKEHKELKLKLMATERKLAEADKVVEAADKLIVNFCMEFKNPQAIVYRNDYLELISDYEASKGVGEFEKWKQESVDDEMRAGLEIAGEYFDLDYLWNAAKEISKQHWLDKAIDATFWKGSSMTEEAIAEAIKELKK